MWLRPMLRRDFAFVLRRAPNDKGMLCSQRGVEALEELGEVARKERPPLPVADYHVDSRRKDGPRLAHIWEWFPLGAVIVWIRWRAWYRAAMQKHEHAVALP
jgi:hypothetical protein